VSATASNSVLGSFVLYKKTGSSVQICQHGRARAGAFPFPVQVGLTWAGFGPILFMSFLFPFLPELKKFYKIVEKC
jgi:hypothetical protein